MKPIVLAYLRWRYGKLAFALKPPLGPPPGSRPSVRYRLARRRWLVECWLFARYGQQVRDAWLRFVEA